MRSFLLLLIVAILLNSCTKTDKSMLNSPCTDSCTVVQGRFITGNNEGVANIPIEIKSEIRPTLGLGQTTIRRIASGTTDNNGFYFLKFGLNEREYGQMADAYISMYFNYDKSRFVPVTGYENFGTSESLGPFARKDTQINANIYLTSRSKLKVRLENFVPIQTGDNFSVLTSCGEGLERHYSDGGLIEANQQITEKEIEACGNEQTVLYIRKRKNGVTSSASTTVLTPTGRTAAITFTY
jgi:hypothetical protein